MKSLLFTLALVTAAPASFAQTVVDEQAVAPTVSLAQTEAVSAFGSADVSLNPTRCDCEGQYANRRGTPHDPAPIRPTGAPAPAPSAGGSSSH